MSYPYSLISGKLMNTVTEFTTLRHQLDKEEYKEYEEWALNHEGWSFEAGIVKVQEILGNRLEREIFGD